MLPDVLPPQPPGSEVDRVSRADVRDLLPSPLLALAEEERVPERQEESVEQLSLRERLRLPSFGYILRGEILVEDAAPHIVEGRRALRSVAAEEHAHARVVGGELPNGRCGPRPERRDLAAEVRRLDEDPSALRQAGAGCLAPAPGQFVVEALRGAGFDTGRD